MKNPSLNKIISIVFLSIFCIISHSFAQAEKEAKQEVDFENWRVLLQVNGPSNWKASINAVKPISRKWAIRFGISPIISFNRSKGGNDFPAEYSFYKDENSSKKFGGEFSLGAEYHLLQKGKVDPYILFGSGFGVFAESNNRHISYQYVDPLSSGLYKLSREGKSKGSPRFSFDPFIGFGLNFFFNPRMAIGAEYSIGPNMILVKGRNLQKQEEIKSYLNGNDDKEYTEIESKLNSFYLNVNQSVGLHFIYIVNRESKQK